MTDQVALAHRVDAMLAPDPSRVVFRLFLPGEETRESTSRVGAVVARVLALPEDEVEEYAARLHRDFWADQASVAAVVAQNARVVSAHVDDSLRLPDTFVLRFRDPGRIVITGGGEHALGCGAHKPQRVTIEYFPKPDARLTTAGEVASIEFQ